MRDRQEEIHSKGFSLIQKRQGGGYEGPTLPVDYNKVKVNTKTLEDAVLNLGSLRKVNRNYANKEFIQLALAQRNLPVLREISNFFYATDGIYQQICDYCAYLYRFDWYITPEIYDNTTKEEKVLKEFNSLLSYLDDSHIKMLCGQIASTVIREGAYYGYIVPCGDKLVLQQLPVNYCRSRFYKGNPPAVEFNMKFFDEHFNDINQRMRVIKMFPDEFAKGYILFKQGKLNRDFHGDAAGWYMLEPENTVKFNIRENDMPTFVTAIPTLLDLDAAQDLDRRKQMQDLLKIVIQKLPLDKNGDLIFDIDEAREIHNNACEMLEHTIGTDVLTTFADIKVENMSDRSTATTKDDLEKIERTVFNAFGISKNIFNPSGNLSLEKSILQDESKLRGLLLQFQVFFDRIAQRVGGKNKKYCFRLYMLETTQYNYMNLAKLYKEQVQNGYSKMLPQIALGHSQSSIIHTAYFENKVLKLSEIMIPPLMSSTMSSEDLLGKKDSTDTSKTQKPIDGKTKSDSGEVGRPEKEDSQKSEKTIQNKESMS